MRWQNDQVSKELTVNATMIIIRTGTEVQEIQPVRCWTTEVYCINNPLPPDMEGGVIPFLSGKSSVSIGWLVLLLTKAEAVVSYSGTVWGLQQQLYSPKDAGMEWVDNNITGKENTVIVVFHMCSNMASEDSIQYYETVSNDNSNSNAMNDLIAHPQPYRLLHIRS